MSERSFLQGTQPASRENARPCATSPTDKVAVVMPATILIADDHEIVREGIRQLIARSRPDWKICCEVGSGEEAVASARELKPDVVIMDISMLKMNGLEAAGRIASLGVGCRVLMFTMHNSERLANDARAAGAKGFVLKSQAGRDLIRAIDQLLSGNTFFQMRDSDNSSLS